MVSVAPTKVNLSQPGPSAQGPNSVTVENPIAENLETSRTKAEKLSSKTTKTNLDSRQTVTKPVFVNVMDFIRKNTSRALWGLGLGTGGLGVASYFLIGSKILSMIFAVPTLMSFFIAHHLGKNVTIGKNNLFLNPLDQIESYIADPQKIDAENIKALQSIDELKDLIVSKPERKEEIVSLLKRFKDIIEIKYNQVKDTGDNSSDIYSSRLKLDTERLLSALDSINELKELNSSTDDTDSKKSN